MVDISNLSVFVQIIAVALQQWETPEYNKTKMGD